MHELASRSLFERDTRGLTDNLAAIRGWVFHQMEYPIIDCEFREDGRTPLRVKFVCDDWNDQPPAIQLLSADGSFLTKLTPNHTNVFHQGPHGLTGHPFICMRGSREYHTHESHLNDRWDAIKHEDRYRLGEILTQVWRAWRKGQG